MDAFLSLRGNYERIFVSGLYFKGCAEGEANGGEPAPPGGDELFALLSFWIYFRILSFSLRTILDPETNSE
jgi:hypothetical protein